MTRDSVDGWRRLHPLSPIVRGGRATIAVGTVLLLSLLAGGRGSKDTTPELVIVGIIVALGFVSWIVTRWKIDGDDLRIESGVLRRQSLRFPLSQVQAIDVVRPGLARIFGVAELRLRTGGSSGDTARLAYLAAHEAEPLRARLLRLAEGARTHEGVREHEGAPQPEPSAQEHVLTTVPTGRLIASVLISDVGILAEAVLAALIVTALLSPAAATGVIGAGAVWIVAMLTPVWRRFNQEYRLSLAEAPDGLRLRSGLIALSAETIRPGRVQAVRMVEPLFWRALGWCRLEVDLAGKQRGKGEGQAERRPLRTVLPVGSRALAEELLERIVPDRPRAQTPPPRRVRLKSPLRYPMLAWGRSDSCVVTTSGRIRRVTVWARLEKVQSLRRVQGPIQRRLQLATVHVDTAGHSVHAAIRDRDVSEADRALAELSELARVERRRKTK
ncbi:MAG: PH domain-containing protein [Gaiellaceae bacterium]